MMSALFRKNALSYGWTCVFTALSPKVGLKVYPTKAKRDYAYRTQCKAHKHKLGPAAYGIVDLEKGIKHHGQTRLCKYGYLTEVAKTKRTQANTDKLVKRMRRIGLVNEDAYWDNVGYIRNRMVCLDFDRVSVRPAKGRSVQMKR